MRLLRQADIEACLPMSAAMRLMEKAFAAISKESAQAAERQAIETSAGHALLMGAAAPGQGIVAKLVTVIPANRSLGLPVSSGLGVLLDERDGRPLAVLDATALTAWRTAAAVACATGVLARQDARLGLLLGCGTQARAQLIAMDTARELEEIGVFARDPDRAGSLIEVVQPECRARLRPVSNLPEAAGQADIITAATTSASPVIDGSWVAGGAHVNGIGSFRPGMCEFDNALIEKATVYVESLATAQLEAGELIAACHSGHTAASCWFEMGEVVCGNAPGRSNPQEITFFKSVGHAVFDLFAAGEIHRQAGRLGLGTEWSL